MNVKTTTISLPIAGDSSLEDFLEYLKQEPINLMNVEVKEILVVDKLRNNPPLEHLWTGFLLTRKTQRIIPLMRIINEMIEITPQELEQGTNKIDVNYFLVNPDSQKGLYQTYYGSPSFSNFGHFLGTKFMSFRAIKGINAEFTPREVVKQDSLDDYLERIENVQQLVYEYEMIQDRATTWDLLKSKATSEVIKLVFRKKKLNWRNIKREIKNAVEMNNFKQFKIQGKTEDKLNKFFDLFENIAVVDLQEFDGYARSLRFRGANLTGSLINSPNVQNLLGLYLQPHIRRGVDARPQ